jgi:hypothetical protein
MKAEHEKLNRELEER